MPRVAVILSGCGVQDGAEIHESVLMLLALEEAGASYACLAPDRQQLKVVNHRTKKPDSHPRNVLVESARIARGVIQDVAEVTAEEFDAVVLPGGFGAALNLCDFGINGDHCTVDPSVEKFLLDMHAAGKPIGAVCIAPALIAKVLGNKGVQVTIGNDTDTAAAIERMGARHVVRKVHETAVDQQHRVVTSPAYMLAKNLLEVKASVTQCVADVLKLTRN